MAESFLKRLVGAFRRRVPETEMAGVTGVTEFGGYLASREKNPDLTGKKRFESFENVLVNTSIVATAVRHTLDLVASASWSFVAPEDGPAGSEEYAAFVHKEIHGMVGTSWRSVVRRQAMERFYGAAIQERALEKRPDGRIGLRDVAQRPLCTIEQWDLDDEGQVVGMVQRSPMTHESIYIPRSKVIYSVDDVLTPDPDGVGLLRHVMEPVRVLRRLEQLELYGFELDLRGMPVVRMPISRMKSDAMRGLGKDPKAAEKADAVVAEARAKMRKFLEKHALTPERGLILDSLTYEGTNGPAISPTQMKLWDLELVRGDNGTLQEATAKALDRKQREVARVLGVEGLMLGDGAGNRALGDVKASTMFLIVTSILLDLEFIFRRDLAWPIYRANGWPRESLGEFRASQVQFQAVADLVDTLLKMSQAGAQLSPHDPAINAIRGLAGLPDYEVVEIQMDAALGPDGKPLPGGPDAPGADGPSDAKDDAEGDAAVVQGDKGPATKKPAQNGKQVSKAYVGKGRAVMLPIPAVVAAHLVTPDGVGADDMHMTLAYLGEDAAEDARVIAAIGNVAHGWATRRNAPLAMRIAGMGRFEQEDVMVDVALIDSADATVLQREVIEALEAIGVAPDAEHGWLPHVTIRYAARGSTASRPIAAVTEFAVDEISFGAGPVRVTWPLIAGGAS